MARGRKSEISLENALDWLHHVESGGTIQTIRRRTNHDPRTIKKNIERARDERDRQAARSNAYETLLLRHFKDLCTVAEKLRKEVNKSVPEKIPPQIVEDPLFKALKQHLPGVSIWRKMVYWNRIAGNYNSLMERLNGRIRTEAQNITRKQFVTSESEHGLSEGLVNAARTVLISKARNEEIGIPTISLESIRDSIVLAQGPNRLAYIKSGEEGRFKNDYQEIVNNALKSSENKELLELFKKYFGLKKYFNNKLTEIILQRFVRGRCRYCPI